MKISIITATYNAEADIEKLILSIIPQKSEAIEFIVIDGNSNDKTVDIIKKYESYIDYWKSEPDEGIYDAWNKGITVAQGDWIMFIGADDQLVSNALNVYTKVIMDNFQTIRNIDFISSKVQMVDKNGKKIRIKGWPFLWPKFLKEMTVAHPGALHSKRIFEKYGKYDTNYKIVGDYELLLRAGKTLKSIYIDTISVVMSEGGASDSVKSMKEHYKAVTSTGKYPKYLAWLNFGVVYSKFKLKKMARKMGLNLYMRKS